MQLIFRGLCDKQRLYNRRPRVAEYSRSSLIYTKTIQSADLFETKQPATVSVIWRVCHTQLQISHRSAVWNDLTERNREETGMGCGVSQELSSDGNGRPDTAASQNNSSANLVVYQRGSANRPYVEKRSAHSKRRPSDEFRFIEHRPQTSTTDVAPLPDDNAPSSAARSNSVAKGVNVPGSPNPSSSNAFPIKSLKSIFDRQSQQAQASKTSKQHAAVTDAKQANGAVAGTAGAFSTHSLPLTTGNEDSATATENKSSSKKKGKIFQRATTTLGAFADGRDDVAKSLDKVTLREEQRPEEAPEPAAIAVSDGDAMTAQSTPANVTSGDSEVLSEATTLKGPDTSTSSNSDQATLLAKPDSVPDEEQKNLGSTPTASGKPTEPPSVSTSARIKAKKIANIKPKPRSADANRSITAEERKQIEEDLQSIVSDQSFVIVRNRKIIAAWEATAPQFHFGGDHEDAGITLHSRPATVFANTNDTLPDDEKKRLENDLEATISLSTLDQPLSTASSEAMLAEIESEKRLNTASSRFLPPISSRPQTQEYLSRRKTLPSKASGSDSSDADSSKTKGQRSSAHSSNSKEMSGQRTTSTSCESSTPSPLEQRPTGVVKQPTATANSLSDSFSLLPGTIATNAASSTAQKFSALPQLATSNSGAGTSIDLASVKQQRARVLEELGTITVDPLPSSRERAKQMATSSSVAKMPSLLEKAAAFQALHAAQEQQQQQRSLQQPSVSLQQLSAEQREERSASGTSHFLEQLPFMCNSNLSVPEECASVVSKTAPLALAEQFLPGLSPGDDTAANISGTTTAVSALGTVAEMSAANTWRTFRQWTLPLSNRTRRPKVEEQVSNQTRSRAREKIAAGKPQSAESSLTQPQEEEKNRAKACEDANASGKRDAITLPIVLSAKVTSSDDANAVASVTAKASAALPRKFRGLTRSKTSSIMKFLPVPVAFISENANASSRQAMLSATALAESDADAVSKVNKQQAVLTRKRTKSLPPVLKAKKNANVTNSGSTGGTSGSNEPTKSTATVQQSPLLEKKANASAYRETSKNAKATDKPSAKRDSEKTTIPKAKTKNRRRREVLPEASAADATLAEHEKQAKDESSANVKTPPAAAKSQRSNAVGQSCFAGLSLRKNAATTDADADSIASFYQRLDKTEGVRMDEKVVANENSREKPKKKKKIAGAAKAEVKHPPSVRCTDEDNDNDQCFVEDQDTNWDIEQQLLGQAQDSTRARNFSLEIVHGNFFNDFEDLFDDD